MIGQVKTFKVKEGDNKLMSLRIDDQKLSEKYKAIWTKIEGLKNIEFNALSVYDKRYIKTKIRTYGDKVYTKFRGLNVSEDDIESEFFTVVSIVFLLVCDKKYYLQVYLNNCTYKTVNKQMTDYLDENLFEDQILQMLCYDRIDISKGIDPTRSDKSGEFMICHYFFFNHGFKFKIMYAMVVTI